MPVEDRVKNHPHAYKRKDGKTQCPDCHALSFDALALESLQCTVPPEPVKKKVEDVHLTNLPPVNPKVGDIWIDPSGALRVATLIEPTRVSKDSNVTVSGAWIMPTDKERHYMIQVPAPWKDDYNPEVVEVGLAREVSYLKSIDDIEHGYYQQEMVQALDEWLDEHKMIAVSPAKFELSENLSKASATAHINALARTMPDPQWKHEWWNDPWLVT